MVSSPVSWHQGVTNTRHQNLLHMLPGMEDGCWKGVWGTMRIADGAPRFPSGLLETGGSVEIYTNVEGVTSFVGLPSAALRMTCWQRDKGCRWPLLELACLAAVGQQRRQPQRLAAQPRCRYGLCMGAGGLNTGPISVRFHWGHSGQVNGDRCSRAPSAECP